MHTPIASRSARDEPIAGSSDHGTSVVVEPMVAQGTSAIAEPMVAKSSALPENEASHPKEPLQLRRRSAKRPAEPFETTRPVKLSRGSLPMPATAEVTPRPRSPIAPQQVALVVPLPMAEPSYQPNTPNVPPIDAAREVHDAEPGDVENEQEGGGERRIEE